MSPRRRLRNRYEPPAAPIPPPPEPAAAGAPDPNAAVPEFPADSADAVFVPVEGAESRPHAVEVEVAAAGETAALVEPARDRRHHLRATLTLVGFALAAFATGVVVFNSLVMPRLIHGVGDVKVPDLSQLTLSQAEQALRPIGLQLSRSGERFDPVVPRGFVLSQEPEAGTFVRGRKRVSVMVSLGEEFSSVPDLTGESVRSARLLIERAGLRFGTSVEAPSDEVGEGLVAGSDPGAEAVLPRDTPVHLLVSTGPAEESYVMPELLGREISGVRRQLEALGFIVEMPPAAPAVGTLVMQEPGAGARITHETTIRVLAAGRMIR